MRNRLLSLLLLTLLLAGMALPARPAAAETRVPLVLIHGLFGSAEGSWTTATAFFEQKGYVAGTDLFAIDLNQTGGAEIELGLLHDASAAAEEIRKILKQTGAAQVDLVGANRGGLIVRILAAGETSAMVRRAVAIGAPNQGLMPMASFNALFDLAEIPMYFRTALIPPADLMAGSAALKTLEAREKRFADRRSPALVIGTAFQDGPVQALVGHDGFTTLESQLAWPDAAATFTARLGLTHEELVAQIREGVGYAILAEQTPAALAADSPVILGEIHKFLTAPEVKGPVRACHPNCQDFAAVQRHWSKATVMAMLPDRLPYETDGQGNFVFDPEKPATRAEFVYALVKALGLHEDLGATAFADLKGHWALGYVEAAVAAKLVTGLSADTFGPDQHLTRAQAATLVARAKKLEMKAAKTRFGDVPSGHWATAAIEAAAEAGIITGDAGKGTFRPEDPVKMGEMAVIISRAFPKQ